MIRRIIFFLIVFVFVSSSFTPAFADDVIRVGVLSFESKTDYISQLSAEAITDELTRMLANSYSIAIVDRSVIDAIAREHNMYYAGLIDPNTAAQIGAAAGIQYLITGAVTNYRSNEQEQYADTSDVVDTVTVNSAYNPIFNAFRVRTSEQTLKAEVTLDLRIIDVNTHEVVLSMAETGTATQTFKSTSGSSGGSSSYDSGGLMDSAISDAVARIGHRIKEAVAGEYPQVLRVSNGEVYLSLGATSGVKIGNRYKISLEGEEIFDMRGNVVGRDTQPLAIVEVDYVQNDYSTARVIKRGGNIANVQRGDRIESVSPNEINDLIKRKKIPDRRPRRSVNMSSIEEGLRTSPSASPALTTSPAVSPVSPASVSASSITAIPENASIFDNSPRGARAFDNSSTDPSKVIPTYGLPKGEAKAREELHRKLQRAGKNKRAYDRYVEMANTFKGDYLAMYQAGIIAQALGRKNDAVMWIDKALSANPNYEPAIRAKENLNKSAPAKKNTTKKRK